MFTTSSSSYDSGSGNGAVNNRDIISEFGFEDGIEIFRSSDRYKTIIGGKFCEYSDIVRIFELTPGSHDYFISFLFFGIFFLLIN